MRRGHHYVELIVRQLAEDEKLHNAGYDIAETCRQLEISESTEPRWKRMRRQFG